LTGIDAPPGAKNLDVKPYAVADLTTDVAASPAIANDPDGHVGLDVKYGVGQSLTADLTYNTDFAQVEADEQQVNLTRFSLFFRRSASSSWRTRARSVSAPRRPAWRTSRSATRRCCSTAGASA